MELEFTSLHKPKDIEKPKEMTGQSLIKDQK